MNFLGSFKSRTPIPALEETQELSNSSFHKVLDFLIKKFSILNRIWPGRIVSSTFVLYLSLIYYFLIKVKVKSLSHVWLCDPVDCSPTRLLHPWDSPGKNTGVSCHFLLQGILPTQGSNPDLPHCRQTLYPLSHEGKSIVNSLTYTKIDSQWEPAV